MRSWPQLARRLKTLRRLHRDEFEDVSVLNDQERDRYPYLELKLMDLMDVSECPLIVAPNDPQVREDLEQALVHDLNYRGKLLFIRKDGPTQQEAGIDEDALQHWFRSSVFMEPYSYTAAKRELDVRWALRVQAAVRELCARDPRRWVLRV